MESVTRVPSLLKNIRLVSYKSGLSIKWKIDNGKSGAIELTLLLSSYAAKGSLFPTVIPCLVLKHALNLSLSSHATQTSYAVACNSGEIFLVNLHGTGSFAKICQSQGNIVWIDFFKELRCLGLLGRNGRMVIGIVNEDLLPNIEEAIEERDVFQWKSLSLSVAPVCCLSVEDFLVLSDGHSSYFIGMKVSKAEKSIKIDTDELRLPFMGIVHMKKQDSDIILSTCDGRVYKKSLFELKQLADKSALLGNSNLHLQGLNLSQALLGIKTCSDVAKEDSIKIEEFNIYLEQISIAQILFSELPKKLFHVDLAISQSVEKEGYFLLSIYIKLVSNSFKFGGKWWQLNVRLKECGNLNFLYSDMSSLKFTQTVKVLMHIPDKIVKRLLIDSHSCVVNVDFDLVLTNFASATPVCCLTVHKEPLDIIHFLTLHRSEGSSCSLLESNFERNVAELFKPFNSGQNKYQATPSRSFELKKMSLLLGNRHTAVLQKALPHFLASEATYSKQLWLQNVYINVTIEKAKDDHFKVFLEGPYRPLIVAVKFSLERRTFQNNSLQINKNDKIQISPEILKQARVCKLILDLETAKSISPFVVQRMYESVSNLIANIPL